MLESEFVVAVPGLSHLACHCLGLTDLDISGCLNITNNSLYALQESLLHLRSECKTFSIALGGESHDHHMTNNRQVVPRVALTIAQDLCIIQLSNVLESWRCFN